MLYLIIGSVDLWIRGCFVPRFPNIIYKMRGKSKRLTQKSVWIRSENFVEETVEQKWKNSVFVSNFSEEKRVRKKKQEKIREKCCVVQKVVHNVEKQILYKCKTLHGKNIASSKNLCYNRVDGKRVRKI